MSEDNLTPDNSAPSFKLLHVHEEATPSASAEEIEAVLDNEETVETDTPATREEEREEADDKYSVGRNLGPIEIIKRSNTGLVLVSGALGGAVAALATYFYAPIEYIAVMALIGFGLGALARIDKVFHTIKNEHTITLAALAVPLTVISAFYGGDIWDLAWAAGTAVVVFGIFIVLILITGFGSGGDIKLSPVPAFALGAISPIAAILWLFLAFIFTLFSLLFSRGKNFAFGPAMALAVSVSIVLTFFAYQAAHLPYLTVP